MKEKLDLLGAIAAHIIFISSIVTFSARILLKTSPGNWIGIPLLLMVFPLGYLLYTAPRFDRPLIYYIQVITMVIFLIVLFLVDYIFKFDFRQTQWMVISFVMLYFAGMGGMIGISSHAGRGWTISAIVLFFIAGIMAFVKRAITGF